MCRKRYGGIIDAWTSESGKRGSARRNEGVRGGTSGASGASEEGTARRRNVERWGRGCEGARRARRAKQVWDHALAERVTGGERVEWRGWVRERGWDQARLIVACGRQGNVWLHVAVWGGAARGPESRIHCVGPRTRGSSTRRGLETRKPDARMQDHGYGLSPCSFHARAEPNLA